MARLLLAEVLTNCEEGGSCRLQLSTGAGRLTKQQLRPGRAGAPALYKTAKHVPGFTDYNFNGIGFGGPL